MDRKGEWVLWNGKGDRGGRGDVGSLEGAAGVISWQSAARWECDFGGVHPFPGFSPPPFPLIISVCLFLSVRERVKKKIPLL